MRALLLVAATVGCGTDGPCEPDGRATVTGSVQSASFAPITSAYMVRQPGGVAIALVEQGDTCGAIGPTSQDLVLLFCDVPVATRYDVIADTAFACPTSGADVLFEQDGGTDFAKSTGGGDVTISRVGDHCIAGTYTAMFAGEMLTGDFDAVVCP
jgi:hypothetical protein